MEGVGESLEHQQWHCRSWVDRVLGQTNGNPVADQRSNKLTANSRTGDGVPRS